MRSCAVRENTRKWIMTQNHNFFCAFSFLLRGLWDCPTSLYKADYLFKWQVLWLASIKTSPSCMYMGRERNKNSEYSTWWKIILLISLFMLSNSLLVEAIRLSVKYDSLLIVTEPAFDLIFHTVILVIQYSNQGTLCFAKTAAQTWKTFILKLFLHA